MTLRRDTRHPRVNKLAGTRCVRMDFGHQVSVRWYLDATLKAESTFLLRELFGHCNSIKHGKNYGQEN